MNINDFTASANITVDDFISIKKEYREEYFYNLCSTEKSSLQVKKLFLMPKTKQMFDADLLAAGLFSAIENKQEPYIELIINFSEKNNIKFNEYHCNPLFNCSFHYENTKLVEYFNNKYDVVKKTLSKEVKTEIYTDGIIYRGGYAVDGPSDNNSIIPGNFLNNLYNFKVEPLKFAALNLNEKMLNFILEESENQINPLLIEKILVDSILSLYANSEIALFLLSNKVTKKIIEESKNINLFLDEPTYYPEIKKEIKTALLMLDLTNSLENKNKTINKPKI